MWNVNFCGNIKKNHLKLVENLSYQKKMLYWMKFKEKSKINRIRKVLIKKISKFSSIFLSKINNVLKLEK